jgi:ABC-type transport system substrate-binding protein
VVLFNANDEEQSYTMLSVKRLPFALHPVQAEGSDPIVKNATFDPNTGTFTVPGRTTAVFMLKD